MRLSDKISGSLSSKYDKSILSALNESCETELNEKINDSESLTWDKIDEYSEEEKEEIFDILDKLDLTAIKHEGNKENGYSVAIKDNNSGLVFWIDYTKEGSDIYGDWNQYIFQMTDKDDRIRQAIQTATSEDNYPFAFEDMEAEGLQYLKDKGLVKDSEEGMIFESCEKEVNEDYDLDARYDSRASFYGKAEVKELDNGDKELYSYGTLVAAIRDGKPYTYGRFSQTTSRHQKEFFKQEGFEPSEAELIEESEKLNEEITDDTAQVAKYIALEIKERGIMNFQDIDQLAIDQLGITMDEYQNNGIDTDIYTSLNYEGIDQNFSTGDFFTQEYAEEHPEVLEESEKLSEDEHTDNFVVSLLVNDHVHWKRNSDGKELITNFEVFGNGMDPTEYKTEEELSNYIIDED